MLYFLQKIDGNKEKYEMGDEMYKLIQYQILHTNIIRTVWQTERRITTEILGVRKINSHSLNVHPLHTA